MRYFVRDGQGNTVSVESKKEGIKVAYHFARYDMFNEIYGTQYHVFTTDGIMWISDIMFAVGYENGLTLYQYDNRGRHLLRHWVEY